MFEIVVATDKAGGIGIDNHLPWKDRADLKKFKLLTSTCRSGKVNAVIMGKNTWSSIPIKPLPGRKNIVVTRSTNLHEDISIHTSLQNALDACYRDKDIDRIFVIGGARMYEEALLHPDCHIVHKSTVDSDVPCDTFFPELDMSVWNWIMGDLYMRSVPNGASTIWS
jgi:dihydrofolate reductase